MVHGENIERSRPITRRRLLQTAGVSVSASLSGCAGSMLDSSSDPLVIYSPTDDDFAKIYEDEEGAQTKIVTGPGAQTIARFLNEESSGTHVADIVRNKVVELSGDQISKELTTVSELTGDSEYIAGVGDLIQEKLSAPDKQIPYVANARVLCYNTDNVSDPPTTYDDLLADRFADSIVAAPYNMDSCLATFEKRWGREQAEQYLQKLDEHGVSYPATSMSRMAEQVSSGQFDVGFMLFGNSISDVLAESGSLAVAVPEFTSLMIESVGLSADAPHQKKARQYLKFVTSDAAQKQFRSYGGGRLTVQAGSEHGNPDVAAALDGTDLFPVVFTPEESKRYQRRIESLIGVGGG